MRFVLHWFLLGGVNLPCHLVIVKGTEYFDGKTKAYIDFPVTDILQMMGRAGRPQFDDSAVAVIMVHEPRKQFYRKFLHEPFPVESSLHHQLHEHINAEICNGSIHSIQDCVEYLTWTYYFRRLLVNPNYYGLTEATPEQVQQHLISLVQIVLKDLVSAECLYTPSLTALEEMPMNQRSKALINSAYAPSYLGKIASFYYLHYETPLTFKRKLQELLPLHWKYDREEQTMEEQGVAKKKKKNEASSDLKWYRILYMLKLLCDAKEFSEIPVRHNEELLNAELVESLGYTTKSPLFGEMESSHTKALLLLIAAMKHVKLPISDYINDTKTVMDQVARVLNSMVDIAAEEGWAEIVLYIMRASQLLGQRTTEVEVSSKGFLEGGLLVKIREVGLEGEESYVVPKKKDGHDLPVLDLPTNAQLETKISIEQSKKQTKKQREDSERNKNKSEGYWLLLTLSRDIDSAREVLAMRRLNGLDKGIYEMTFTAPATAGVHNMSIMLVNDSQVGRDRLVNLVADVY